MVQSGRLMNCANLQRALPILAVLFGIVPTSFPASLPLPILSASREYLVENWQTENGLPRNTITSIAQDRHGYLWLGTPYGLVRFDGARFAAFERDTSAALAQGEVRQVFPDVHGTLWIGTRRSSLLRWSPEGRIMRIESPLLPPDLAIDSMAQDRRGTLWLTRGDGQLLSHPVDGFQTAANLSTTAGGTLLFKLASDDLGRLWFYKQNAYGLINEDGGIAWHTTIPGGIVTLAPSRGGKMWLCTGRDIRLLTADQKSTQETAAALPFPVYSVTVLYEDRSGTLWIGTRTHGLFRWDGRQMHVIDEVHHTIRAIQEDRESNLWVGTEGAGLFKLRPRQFRLVGIAGMPPNEDVRSVWADWVVPGNGGLGRIVSDGQIDLVEPFAQNRLTSVCDDGDGGIWAGTTGGRLIHFGKDGERSPPVVVGPAGTQPRVLFRDSKGNLWIGCFPNGLFFLPAGEQRRWRDYTPNKSRGYAITSIAEDKAGAIWVGTVAGEVHRHEGGGRRFTTYGTESGLPGSPIGALLFSREDTLWIGTLGSGLGCFKKNDARFVSAPGTIGDNVISQLIDDGQGWLWIGSSHGIYRVRLPDLHAFMEGKNTPIASVPFGRTDGLASVECVAGFQPSVWRSPSGQLRFATSKGVVIIDSESLPFNKEPPPLHLEEMLVDGVAVNRETEIRLSHTFKKIEFVYTALSFTAPDKVRFKRQLLGFDEAWVEDGTTRSAIYPRLPPGRYQFRFTACNNDGLWNDEPAWVSFEVEPALWQTAWFRGGGLLLFAGLVAGVVRYASILRMRRHLRRLKQAHALDRERVRIARDLHDDLGARLTQMAFVTDLAAMEPEAPPDMKAQLREVSEQARLATRSLDETVWMVDPRKDSVPQLIAYVSHYANEFFRRTAIRCRQQISVNMPDRALPGELRHHIFFAVKEALANVLKHSNASEVWLRVTIRGSLLRIGIFDNGRGFPAARAAAGRNGLENIRRRMEAAGGRFMLRTRPNQGTQIIFRIPLPTNSSN
jgi:ligand-binding sensor domain-containing protein/signal transduction histidine kinase